MNLNIRSVLLLYLFFLPIQLFSQGLKIQGNNYFIDDRSSYSVFDKVSPKFKDRLILDFEMASMDVRDNNNIGYILRIKNEDTNTTYNILYNDQGGETVFKFNHEGRDVLINASLNKERLHKQQWINMHLDFDLLQDSLKLVINGEAFSAGGLRLNKEWSPRIYFGRSEHVIDVPTFGLRNLTVSDNEKEYIFPLNENEGEVVHDSSKKIIGHVTNPVWLINDAYFWKGAGAELSSGTVAGSNINVDTQQIYYFNEDSITFYNIRTKEVESHRYNNECPIRLILGTNFVDAENKRLYAYEVYRSQKDGFSVAYLDLETLLWTPVSTELTNTQLHHHGSYFDALNRRYIIFGGFGNATYNKNFYSFNLDTNSWETLKFTGDRITPRYFASVGSLEGENALYVFGGMGNESGDHTVGRVYYYELYRVDLNENKITKLWEIPWKKENVVPVCGMVMTDNKHFYTLCYPEHFSKSALKLYRFSVQDGSYEVLGDSIPIVSEKITTNANLYYNRPSNELYTIVQEFDYNDIGSTARIYSLAYPPVTKEGLLYYSQKKKSTIKWLFLIPIVIAVTMPLFSKRKKKGKDINDNKEDVNLATKPTVVVSPAVPDKRVNAIYLFGHFSICDRKGKDITYMLSTKLKQAFFIILQYSLDNGITTQELSELLWPNKPEDKVKNSRGVTINNLRKILSELNGVKLIHEKGFYKITVTAECYCDYLRCLDIVNSTITEDSLKQLVQIVSRGKFLKSNDIPMLDSFKESVERKLEPVLIVEMEKTFTSHNYHTTVALCEALFHVDPLNEDALHYIVKSLVKLKMGDEAKRKYFSFVAEYRATMDRDYEKTFSQLTD